MVESNGTLLPSVSVVVPTYNRRQNLEPLIARLASDAATTEIVVVVDGSNDDSLEMLERLAEQEPRLRPVAQPNRGLQAARQLGAVSARGEIVVFLDDDVLPSPALVTGHARHHARRSADVVVGYMPVLLPPERQPGQFASYLYASEYEEHCAEQERDPSRILKSLWMGNVSLRREDCVRIGMQSEPFSRVYHEDTDLGLRFHRAGLRATFDRSLLATHLHTRALRAFRSDARSQGIGRWHLRQLHTEVDANLTTALSRDLPAVARALLSACRRAPWVCVAVSTVLSATVVIAGRLRRFGLETNLARVLRRVEQQYGVELAEQRRREVERSAPSLP
ncbi:MAG TPA: glycosyltransferase family 2 protein [Acidimicrobiales bacterium]|nr:glycosyltransferase family 2 protein [Acidimicrobiales bacterium]